MALFESYERRIDKINAVLSSYGIASIEEAEKITKDAGLNVYDQVKGIQPICFENACWAYTVGAAIAIKKGCKRAADAAAAIGEGLQAFCIPGSVADQRKVGLGHGNLGKMLLEEETECFCFLAGHESFAAAEGAIGIAEKANKVRQKPLRVIMNGLGKNSTPTVKEAEFITRWLKDYGFTTDIILEACNRTVMATDKHRFEYAERILKSWHGAQVRHKADILALDDAYAKTKASRPSGHSPTGTNSSAAGSFNQFLHTDYDFEALEKEILSN